MKILAWSWNFFVIVKSLAYQFYREKWREFQYKSLMEKGLNIAHIENRSNEEIFICDVKK